MSGDRSPARISRSSVEGLDRGSELLPSVQLQLKLCVVAPAPLSAAIDRDYPPLLARKDALEIAVEQLSVGRGHFKAESIVAVAHDFACHLPRGTGNIARQ